MTDMEPFAGSVSVDVDGRAHKQIPWDATPEQFARAWEDLEPFADGVLHVIGPPAGEFKPYVIERKPETRWRRFRRWLRIEWLVMRGRFNRVNE